MPLNFLSFSERTKLSILIFCTVFTISKTNDLKPIIIDEGKCPDGWTNVGLTNKCVQLNFQARAGKDAEIECKKVGAELVNIFLVPEFYEDNNSDLYDKNLLEDMMDLINEAYEAGVVELTWIIGGNIRMLKESKTGKVDYIEGLRYLADFKNTIDSITFRDNLEDNGFIALRKKTISNMDIHKSYEIITVNEYSIFPFICSLMPLRKKALIYAQAFLPSGAPKIISEMSYSPLYYTPENGAQEKFIRLPCNAEGNPKPIVKWYQNGKSEEINVNLKDSPFIVSGGALLINTTRNTDDIFSFHCTATNNYGTVRSDKIMVRPVFIEPFRETRLDVYSMNSRRMGQISSGGISGGTRIECDQPNHYPKSYAFSWMVGESGKEFIQISERIFISMDGTLYFSYNLPEDADKYACILSFSARQSALHGPFFRLILPSNDSPDSNNKSSNLQQFAPRIDEYQPSVFPEFPIRGQTVFIECFAYGNPAPIYKWSRVDGMTFSSRVRILNYGHVLRIENVQLKDAVRYKCTAKNNVGIASAEIQLIIQSPPTILRPMLDQLVSENHSTIFVCHVKDSNYGSLGNNKNGGGQSTIEWFKNAHPIVPILMDRKERRRFRIQNNEFVLNLFLKKLFRLRIFKVQKSDEGVYECIVSNDVGSVSTSALLTVENFGPKFHANIFPSKVFVTEGSKLVSFLNLYKHLKSLPCFYLASPLGQAQWHRINHKESHHERALKLDYLIDKNNADRNELAILSFEHIHLADSGDYECLATNSMGEARAIVQVSVLTSTKSLIMPETLNPNANSLKLSCEVEINCLSETGKTDKFKNSDECPEALFEWKFNDRPIRSLSLRLDDIKVRQNEFNRRSTSIFHSRTLLDSSFKQFSILNKNDSEFFHYSLPPKRLFKTELELSKDFARKNNGRFSCSSAFGTGTTAELEALRTSFFVVGPIQVIIETTTDLSEIDLVTKSPTLNLTWTKATFLSNEKRRTQLKVLGYQIEYRSFPSRNWIIEKFVPCLLDSESYTFSFHNLIPNEKYQFRIRTQTSDAHLGIPATTAWHRIPPTPPHASVHNLRHTVLDDRHLLIEWDSLDHPMGPNLRYNVSWSSLNSDDDGLKNSQIVKEPNFLLILANNLNDLKKCSIIAINVRPFNDIGSGLLATETLFYLTNEGPKRKAVNPELFTLNSTHLNFTWSWIIDSADCENVYGAQIACVEIDAQNFTNNLQISTNKIQSKSTIKQSIPIKYNYWLIHSLNPLSNYSCTITAFDHHGRFGETSNSAYAKTAIPAPTKAPEITYLRLKHVNNGRYAILIDWKFENLKKSEENSSINNQTGYKIYIYVSETAENPIELVLYESQLQDLQKPSAQIDGLKTMFYYTIQIMAFNPGGTGPPSRQIPFRIDGEHAIDFKYKISNGSKIIYSLQIIILNFAWIFILIRNFCE